MNRSIEQHVIGAIRALYMEDGAAHEFFDQAATRHNDVAETTVDRIAQMANVPRVTALQLAKSLEEAGCGELIVGRKGWKTRLQWRYSLPNLGKTAMGQAKELKEIDPDVAADARDQQEANAAAVPQRLTIGEAKRGLAETLGIDPEKIEINIRG